MVAVASSSCVVPRLGLAALEVDLAVGVRAEHHPVLHRQVGDRLGQLGVDEEHRRPRVLEDVLDLHRGQPEVDRHQHPPVAAHPEERREQATGVLREHRDPLAAADAPLVEVGGLGPGQLLGAPVGDPPQPAARCVGLVDDPDAVAVDEGRSVEVAADGHGGAHAGGPYLLDSASARGGHFPGCR